MPHQFFVGIFLKSAQGIRENTVLKGLFTSTQMEAQEMR
jgi:hypothetical protein